MPAGIDDVVKFLRWQHRVFLQFLDPDTEVVCGGIVLDISDHMLKPDIASEVVLLPPPLDVVKEDLPRRERGDLLAEVLLKEVIWELERCLLGPV